MAFIFLSPACVKVNGDSTISAISYEELVVRTNNDVRKLYEERPDCMQPMRLGQLATEYRYLKPSDWGYEKKTRIWTNKKEPHTK